jgi:hypothetical protein
MDSISRMEADAIFHSLSFHRLLGRKLEFDKNGFAEEIEEKNIAPKWVSGVKKGPVVIGARKRGATFNYRLMCVDTSVEGLMSDHDVPDVK